MMHGLTNLKYVTFFRVKQKKKTQVKAFAGRKLPYYV
jgi:hypothetical protein